VPRTLFLDSEGNVQAHLRGKGDPQYPHSIDINNPDELRTLMLTARETMSKSAPAPQQDVGGRT